MRTNKKRGHAPPSSFDNVNLSGNAKFLKVPYQASEIFRFLLLRIRTRRIEPSVDVGVIMIGSLDQPVDYIHQTIKIHLLDTILFGSGIIQKSDFEKILTLYLERPNNQNQSEISKYKPLIVNTF